MWKQCKLKKGYYRIVKAAFIKSERPITTEDIKYFSLKDNGFKCSSCGAEVVIDTAESTQARCHWCRSFLSVNQQIPNGSVPDAVLPFSVKKEEINSQQQFLSQKKQKVSCNRA